MSHVDELAMRAWARLLGACEVIPGTPVVAACSGGLDSVALVELLAQPGAPCPLEEVLFVDHGLRPVEAEADASRLAAERVGVPWRSLKVRLEPGNRQASARHARYRAMLASAGPDRVLATGHTMNDQAETLIQRLLRRSGTRGLSGIRSRQGQIVRPLLGHSRAELAALGLPHSEDPSNATDVYQRNRVRRAIMPALVAESPDAVSALAGVAERLASEHELLLELVRGSAGEPELRLWPDPLVTSWLRLRAESLYPGRRPSGQAVAEAVRRLKAGEEGGVSLGDGLRAEITGGHVDITEERDSRTEVVVPGPGVYLVPGATVTVSDRLENSGAADREQKCCHCWLQEETVDWPLTLRRAQRMRDGRSMADCWSITDGQGADLAWTQGPPGETKKGMLILLHAHTEVVPARVSGLD